MSADLIDRGFARIAEGLVHYRALPPVAGAEGAVPLLLLHLSPASSRSMVPLMLALREAGHDGAIIAPDTLGNGDSAAPARPDADIAYFADSVVRLLDALGLGRADVYGTHTGARIACELGAAHGARIRRVVMDGITEYDAATQAAYTADYVPDVRPDEYGRQMVWGFNFVRDQYLFAPYFKRKADNRLARDIPDAQTLHDGALDILKALDTYHVPYLAAFAYPSRTRAAAVTVPALLLRPDDAPPFLNVAAAEIAALIADGRVADTIGGKAGQARAIAEFLADETVASAIPHATGDFVR